jgi:ATP-dependent exoDNAse (exonuclease V) alpha subunit
MRTRNLEARSGESLLIQANTESGDGRKLANGELVQVAKVQKRGAIELTDGRTIPANFRQFTYGYAVTSHASQGLTVDHVLLALDSQSGPAVNAKQFYVSTSRGREGLRIYTDDVEALREQITRSGHRPLALEVVEAARRLRMRPEIAAQILGKVTSVTDAFIRLTAWRAHCAEQMGPRNSNHVDLWQ